tara:strand:- start:1022 stop:1207 length:186 start_codon:yes stop_codon:yes gene_type:complete
MNLNKEIENLSKQAMAKLNHGSRMEKQSAIGMLKVIEQVRIIIKEEKDDDKLLITLKKIFE